MTIAQDRAASAAAQAEYQPTVDALLAAGLPADFYGSWGSEADRPGLQVFTPNQSVEYNGQILALIDPVVAQRWGVPTAPLPGGQYGVAPNNPQYQKMVADSYAHQDGWFDSFLGVAIPSLVMGLAGAGVGAGLGLYGGAAPGADAAWGVNPAGAGAYGVTDAQIAGAAGNMGVGSAGLGGIGGTGVTAGGAATLGSLAPNPVSVANGLSAGGGAADPFASAATQANMTLPGASFPAASNLGAGGIFPQSTGLGSIGAGGGSLSNLSTLGTIGSLASGAIGALGATSAANTAADAANNATAAQLGMFNTINQQQAPWRAAGQQSLADIQAQQPYFQHQFNAQDLNANLAPNYEFMLNQGLGATKNAANMQTGLLSGNTLKGINDYTQNYAGNAYQQAFNNYSANQNNIFNRLSTIAGLGNAANSSVANTGSTISGNAAQTMVGAGQAQAAGTVGATNAITGGLNNAMGWYSLGNLMGQ